MDMLRRFIPLCFPIPWTRPTLALISVLLLLPVLSAAGDDELLLTLDRPDGCYGEGETAVISVKIAPELLADATWTGTAKWQRNWSGDAISLTWSPQDPVIALPLDGEAPGQIVVTVTLRADADPSSAHERKIGLLYRPEEIELSTPEPEDFDSFWDQQKEEWRNLPQEIRLRSVTSPQKGILCWDLTIELEGEKPVSGYLAMPEKAAPGSLPALISLHGAGVRSSSLTSAANFAAKGFIALDMNAHGLPNGRNDEFYRKKNESDLRGYRSEGVESRETWYFRTMYLRIVTATNYLCSRSEWNGRDLVLRGSSQGGGQALAGAGLDSRVSVVAASVPALCDLTGAPSVRKAGWPGIANSTDDSFSRRTRILDTLAYFDGGLFARRIKAPVILSLGLADPVCPAVGIQAVRNNLAGPSDALYFPAMGHEFPNTVQAAFDEFILDRVNVPSLH